MLIPDGAWSHAEFRAALSKAEAKRMRFPGQTKAPEFLEGDAVESHRIFISTFIQHSTVAHYALGNLLANRYGSLSRKDDWTRARKKALTHYFGNGIRDFAFNYYAATQVLTRDDHLTLYR